MDYIQLLLFIAFIPYYSCSSFEISREQTESNPNENPATLSGLPSEVVQLIIEYTGEPNTLRSINRSLREKVSLKQSIHHFFGINGLGHVDDNNREFNYLLELLWIKNDSYLFFAALTEQIGSRQKPYEDLFRPLVLHLITMFQEFDAQTKQKYQAYLNEKLFISSFLVDRCVETGQFDLIFDFFRDSETLRNIVSEFKDRGIFIQFLRANPRYARRYLDALLDDHEPYSRESNRWIADCIINDLPEEYYERLFAPNLQMRGFYLIKYLFHSANVPESEYQRIHAQISKIFDNHMVNGSEGIVPLRIINDFRYGSFDLEEFKCVDFSSFETDFWYTLARVSLLANKIGLFNEIFEKNVFSTVKRVGVDSILSGIGDLNVYSFQVKNFKFIFEMLRDNSLRYFFVQPILAFVMKFYAVRHLKYGRRVVTFEFEVAENLLEFGFPPDIQIECEAKFINDFIESIFVYMDVYNESTLSSFLPDMIKYNKTKGPGVDYLVPYEFIEFISKFPNLLMLLIGSRLIFRALNDVEFYEKYFNLPNFNLTSQIILFETIFLLTIPKLNSKDQLRKMDWISALNNSGSIPANFLRSESDLMENENPQLVYLEWRLFFDYWIKGPEKESIRLIKTPQIIQMLRLEFPHESVALLGPEIS